MIWSRSLSNTYEADDVLELVDDSSLKCILLQRLPRNASGIEYILDYRM
jgi:hypothetical protein